MTIEIFEIAPNYLAADFRQLKLATFPHDDWIKAVDVFKSRFKSRYFDPLRQLAGRSANAEQIHGFIVLSCAFLLVETLGGFLSGATSHNGRSGDLFVLGLKGLRIENDQGVAIEADEIQKKNLYSNGRCALLHTAGTEKIRVKTSGPAVKIVAGGFEINRDAFLTWIEAEFEKYSLSILHNTQDDLRIKFLQKMNHIAA